jgi:hypothetical protein
MKQILIIFLTFIFIGCEEYDYRLNIHNNTKMELFFTVSQETNFYKYSFKSPANRSNNPKDYTSFLKPGDSLRLQNFGEKSWNNYINYSSSKSLHVYFFSKNIIDTTPWNTIYTNGLYLKHREFSLDELQKIGWNITVDH